MLQQEFSEKKRKLPVLSNFDIKFFIATEKRHQIRKLFVTHIEGIRVEVEVIAVIFQWFLTQQVSLSLLLSDWYWEKWELTDLPAHGRKVKSDKNTTSRSHQRYKGGNNDYCSHFSVTFETTSRFLIVF